MLLTLITAIPALWTAYQKVAAINKDPVDHVKAHLVKNGESLKTSSQIRKIPPQDLNKIKRAIAIDFVHDLIPNWLIRRKWDEEDTGVLVDFACLITKIIRYKNGK